MTKNEKILILKLTVGVPASGKSTWAIDFVKKNKDWVRVSRDEFRFMLKDAPFCDPMVEELITGLVDNTINKALSKGFNVIVDQTSVKSKIIRDFVKKFKSKAKVEVKVFDITFEEALERDTLRDRSVGHDVLKKMYDNYTNLVRIFDFEKVELK